MEFLGACKIDLYIYIYEVYRKVPGLGKKINADLTCSILLTKLFRLSANINIAIPTIGIIQRRLTYDDIVII
jgi:hypothetical protein